MQTLLQINSSIYNGGGQSTQLANRFVEAFLRRYPETRLLKRELGREEVPHLTAERFSAFQLKPEERSSAQHEAVAYSDALIDELRQADVIVLGLPMYNFGVPSQLKGLFRSHRTRRCDLPLHRERSRRSAQGQKGLCVHRPWWRLCR